MSETSVCTHGEREGCTMCEWERTCERNALRREGVEEMLADQGHTREYARSIAAPYYPDPPKPSQRREFQAGDSVKYRIALNGESFELLDLRSSEKGWHNIRWPSLDYVRGLMDLIEHPDDTDVRKNLDQYAGAVYRLIVENREKYIRAWLAETGIKPSDCELVEDRSDPLRTVVSVRRRTPAEPLPATDGRLDVSQRGSQRSPCFRCDNPSVYVIESHRRVETCGEHFQEGARYAMEREP
jgi:hypothetical protein